MPQNPNEPCYCLKQMSVVHLTLPYTCNAMKAKAAVFHPFMLHQIFKRKPKQSRESSFRSLILCFLPLFPRLVHFAFYRGQRGPLYTERERQLKKKDRVRERDRASAFSPVCFTSVLSLTICGFSLPLFVRMGTFFLMENFFSDTTLKNVYCENKKVLPQCFIGSSTCAFTVRRGMHCFEKKVFYELYTTFLAS